jgi:hypothetical protein
MMSVLWSTGAPLMSVAEGELPVPPAPTAAKFS